jgi:outer membrane protein OmpA-like peptidoglycan-associated protein
MKKLGILVVGFVLSAGLLFAQGMDATSTDSLLGKQYVVYYGSDAWDTSGISDATQKANQDVLNTVVAALKQNRELSLRLVGQANPVKGTAKEQAKELLPLSKQRVEKLKSVLEFYGIEANRIKIEYVGGRFSLTGPSDPDGWMNRNVTITIIKN